MNQDQRAIAQLLFQKRLLNSTGQAYENLLIEVLTASEMDFTLVKPQGRVGDRGSDGFDRTTGTYFQVYAPENPKSASTVAKAVNKANADFARLYDYWNNIYKIERYYFSFNDRYQGTQPTLEQALATIKQRYGLADAKVLLAKDLEDHFMRLDYNRMVSMYGPSSNRPPQIPCVRGV